MTMSVKERCHMTEDKDIIGFPFVHRLKQFDTLIPLKVQKGFSSFDITFTCLDVTHHYIGIGTDIGVTYLFDRTTGQIQKLKCEGSTCPVSCIACLETVDLMVAIGTSAGLIIVFQIPLQNPRPCAANQIKQYLITDLHLHCLTCLAWSHNGMKIFSGDKNGLVANTDIDYMQGICKSTELLEEQHSIVQICYHQKLLLVSTLHRTVLCTFGDKLTVTQVGKKERKCLGNFGACFYDVPREPQHTCIYASRPSLRLWKANVEGKVLETFIFKDDALLPSCNISSGLNSSTSLSSKLEPQFGIVLKFMEDFLVSWNDSQLYVITVEDPTIFLKYGDFSNISSVAVCKDEIFLLDGLRNITRIARSSDHSVSPVNVKEDSFLPSLNFVPTALKDIELILKGSSKPSNVASTFLNKLKPKMSPFLSKPLTSTNELAKGPEETEVKDYDVSQLSSLLQNTTTTADSDIVHKESIVFSEDENFNGSNIEVVFQHKPGKNGRTKSVEGFVSEHPIERVQFDPADKSESQITSEQGETKEKEIPDSKTITHLKPIAKFSHDEEVGVKEKYEYEKTYSPMNDRKEKEVLLAKLLNIKELSSEEMTPNFPEIPVMNPRLLCGNNSVDLPKTEESTCSDINNDILDINADLGFSRDENCNISLNEDNSLPYRDIYCSNYINHRERKEDENEISVIPTSECCSYLSYGPPSGSSNLASITSEALHTDRSSGVPCSLPQLPPVLKNQLLDVDAGANAYSLPSDLTKCLSNTPSDFPTDIISSVPNDKIKTEYNSVWIQYKPPGYLSSLSVCDQYIVCTDVKDVVYYASFDGLGLEWHKTNYFARQVSVSPSGKRVWRICDNSAYALEHPLPTRPFGTNWVQMSLNVTQVSVHENWVWYVMHNGNVFCQSDLTDSKTYSRPVDVTCGYKVTQVVCDNDIVWALTSDKKLLSRIGISISNPIGNCWQEVSFGPSDALVVALGIPSTAWVVDDMLKVWFRNGVTTQAPQKSSAISRWWQVNISDYVYQNSSPMQNFTSTLKESFLPEQLTSILIRPNNPLLACSKSRRVWYYHPQNHHILTIQNEIVGHYWNNVTFFRCPSSKWRMMTASGVYHHHGVVWLWDEGSNLYGFNPTSTNVTPIKLPEMCQSSRPLCLGAAPEALWLLTESGRIAIRKDITALNATGSTWIELDLMQIASHKLVHISCGPNLVWACDSKGNILMRIGSLQAPSIPNFPPAWMEVEHDSASGSRPFFTKVYVGPLDYIVWAIDNKNNVYVLEGIFPDLLIGLGWVLVSGIQATDLVISELGVYALTPNNVIFKRYNISRNNYIGDYWMELPGQVKHLSVTVDDNLWALSLQDELLQHMSHTPLGTSGFQNEKHLCHSTDDDWEMIEGCS